MTVGIVGLGLIGGSIGLGLRGPNRQIIGYDPNDEHAQTAVARACIDSSHEFEEVVSRSDVLFVAVPPRVLLSTLDRVRDLRGEELLVTDCASVKREAAEWARREKATWFIPGHPMAGHEKSGPQFASGWMFRGATWLLCPSGAGANKVPKLLKDLILEMGAKPVAIDAFSHDRHVALLSHLPHVLSAELATQAAGLDFPEAAAGSFRDWTRVAGVDPDLWSQILSGNRLAVADALRSFADSLNTWANELEVDADSKIHDRFRAAAASKTKLDAALKKSESGSKTKGGAR